MVEPDTVELPEDGDPGLRDLEADHFGAGAAHPPHLAEGLGDIGHVADAEAHRAGVEAGHAPSDGPLPTRRVTVGKGEIERVAAAELHVELVAAALLAGHLEHLLRNVHPDDPPGGADGPAQGEGEVARAAADVQRRVSEAHAGQHHPHLPPPVVEPGGHEVVQTIVPARDVVEHLPDPARVGVGVHGSEIAPAAHGTNRPSVVKSKNTTLMIPFMVIKATPTLVRSAFLMSQFS